VRLRFGRAFSFFLCKKSTPIIFKVKIKITINQLFKRALCSSSTLGMLSAVLFVCFIKIVVQVKFIFNERGYKLCAV
jgi:hypothetical protein